MIKDTHHLRRSIVALLQSKSPATYQEITKTFQALGATPSAVRTAMIDLKTLGYVEKIDDDVALKAGYENAPLTTSAQLYAQLKVGDKHTSDDLKNISSLESEVLTESAIQALLRDGGLDRLKRGTYEVATLPPVLQEMKLPVDPLRRKLWLTLTTSPQNISDVALACGIEGARIGAILRRFTEQGVVVSDGTSVMRAEEYVYSDADTAYRHFKVGDTFQNRDLRGVVEYPANAIKTLLNAGLVSKNKKGHYEVLPALYTPSSATSSATPNAPVEPTPQDTMESLCDELLAELEATDNTDPKVALEEALEARRLLDQLLNENSLKISKVNALRKAASDALRAADEIEAEYKAEKDRLQEKEAKAREALHIALKQGDLL